MSIRKTIFGSASEMELFRSIERTWHSRLLLYPQVPFCQVFDLDDLHLSASQVKFLRMTSIDYTVCDHSGSPILCIEFDGMGHGFSKDGKYVQMHPSQDIYRKLKLDLKLKVAEHDSLPFYVVSYDEKSSISEEIHLTIVDGIIGQTLKHGDIQREAIEWIKSEEQQLSNLSEIERHERIQDIVSGAEVVAELQWDPIAKSESELEGELWRRGVLISKKCEFLEEPTLPDFDPITGEGFEARIKAWKDVLKWGSRCTLQTIFGDISETCWVRNFSGGSASASPMTIARNISELLACDRATRNIKNSR